jgi:hypothetical protein
MMFESGESEAAMVVQCCLCKQVRKGKYWADALPGEVVEEEVSHGYCPACAAKAFAEIAELLDAKRIAPRAAVG